MTFMPIEELTKFVPNKYRAIMIAAKEARRLNKIPKEEREDKDSKVTSISLKKLITGKIKVMS